MAAQPETTTHEAAEFPSTKEVREALDTLDRLICAAEDAGVYAAATLSELTEAYAAVDRFLNHRERYAR